jgi:excisionase family DNA binding protein
MRDKPALRQSQSRYMNKASEQHRLADSISGLIATITEIINSTVQMAARGDVQVQAGALQPQSPATVQVATYDPVLTKRQLAAHFQVSLRTIDNWCQKGHLPHYKIGRMVRFRLSDIQAEWDAKLKRLSCRSRW